MPEGLLDKNIRVQVYRASIVTHKIDSRQKHAGMTVSGTGDGWHVIH